MQREILEIPSAIKRLLQTGRPEIEAAATLLRETNQIYLYRSAWLIRSRRHLFSLCLPFGDGDTSRLNGAVTGFDICCKSRG